MHLQSEASDKVLNFYCMHLKRNPGSTLSLFCQNENFTVLIFFLTFVLCVADLVLNMGLSISIDCLHYGFTQHLTYGQKFNRLLAAWCCGTKFHVTEEF